MSKQNYCSKPINVEKLEDLSYVQLKYKLMYESISEFDHYILKSCLLNKNNPLATVRIRILICFLKWYTNGGK